MIAVHSKMHHDPIRVFLVEDDDAMRAEFVRMANENPTLSLAGSAATLAEAYRRLADTIADVVVIDLGLPDGDGADLIGWINQRAPEVAILVSTVFGDEAHVVRAVEAGARGYLLKDTSNENFAHCIQMIHEGESPISPKVARHLLRRFAPDPLFSRNGPRHPDALTTREIDILTRISQGFSAVEVARMTKISPHTVTTHIKNIYGKLAVHNRVEAVNAARSKGLIG